MDSELRALLLGALSDPPRALEAIRRLSGRQEAGVAETLFDACSGSSVRARVAALRALQQRAHPLLREALRDACEDESPRVRAIGFASAPIDVEVFLWALANDSSHRNRAIALRRLTEEGQRSAVRIAASDPHWRVRAALVPLLIPEDAALLGDGARSQGIRAWLLGSAPPVATATRCAWDDEDPAVARRNVEEGASIEPSAAVAALSHESAAVRAAARATLRSADARWIAEALALDPRLPGAAEAFDFLTRRLDEDRLQDAARVVVALEPPPERLAWAVRRLEDPSAWRDHESPAVRAAAVRLDNAAEALNDPSDRVRIAALAFPLPVVALRNAFADSSRRFRRAAAAHGGVRDLAAADDDPVVRARSMPTFQDEDHRVRAAAVTTTNAEQALADPCALVWFSAAKVLRRDPARLLGVRMARPESAPPVDRISLTPPDPTLRRPLGSTGLAVSPLGLSGHYGLSVRGFEAGVREGINFLFWEPAYREQSAFMRRLAPSLRDELVVAAGTFEASPKAMAADLERALSQMGLEVLDLFWVFWIRSEGRLRDDVRAYLDGEVARGRIRAWGVSTHQRRLARWALATGVDPLMVRLNAAHRGSEREVLPHVEGQGVVGFSNLLYGRLLEGQDGWKPEAWHCYRYVLELPNVTATWMAPSNEAQLRHNVRAMREPLPEEVRHRLLAHGDRVYERETRFRRCVRAL